MLYYIDGIVAFGITMPLNRNFDKFTTCQTMSLSRNFDKFTTCSVEISLFSLINKRLCNVTYPCLQVLHIYLNQHLQNLFDLIVKGRAFLLSLHNY